MCTKPGYRAALEALSDCDFCLHEIENHLVPVVSLLLLAGMSSKGLAFLCLLPCSVLTESKVYHGILVCQKMNEITYSDQTRKQSSNRLNEFFQRILDGKYLTCWQRGKNSKQRHRNKNYSIKYRFHYHHLFNLIFLASISLMQVRDRSYNHFLIKPYCALY